MAATSAPVAVDGARCTNRAIVRKAPVTIRMRWDESIRFTRCKVDGRSLWDRCKGTILLLMKYPLGRHLPRLGVVMSLGGAACATNTPVIDHPTPVLPPPTASGPLVGAAAGAPRGALAVIPVKVTYVLRTLRPSLDSLFPPRDSISHPQCAAVGGLLCHQYVYRRDSLVMKSVGDQLSITTLLSYRAQMGVMGSTALASCGYPPEQSRRATLSMTTSLYWRRDWRIGARDSRLQASLLDQCLVTVVGMNGTRALKDIIDRQLAAFAVQADTTIPRVADFRPLADSLWRSFLEPTPLDTLGTLWLMLEPEAVRVTPFIGTGPSVTTSIVLYAWPHVVSGSKPAMRLRPLPSLAMSDAPTQFTVPVSVELPFVDVARRATAIMAAEPSRVHVDSMHIGARGDTVTLDLDVSGSMRGRLSMVSRLRWDPTARELRLDGFDWTLETTGLMSRMKATLGAPLVARAVRRATMGGRVPLGAQLDAVRAELMHKLNGPIGPGVVMGSSVSDLQILGVTTTATSFVVSARLTGTSGVWFQR